jgi:streptogramin lyase
VVLNGFGQTGITLVPDTGTSVTRIDFADLYDGGGFALERDTLLTTSSKSAGSLLYVADLRARSLLKLQLPVNSNPGGAAFGNAAVGARVLVALRDSGAIALVNPRAGTADITLLRNAGRCPTDVFVYAGAVWSVDANQNCGVGYVPQGASRLIRMVPGSAARDTIQLGGFVVGAGSAAVIGDFAYVGAGGYVDYSVTPFRNVAGPTVTKVDLRTRQVVQTYRLPEGSVSAGVRVGGDGRLYVSYYADLATFANRVLALDPQTLVPVGPRVAGGVHLNLTRADGTTVPCSAATADASGRIYCVTNGTASVATLHVFDSAGRQLRTAPAGQGAVDLAVR